MRKFFISLFAVAAAVVVQAQEQEPMRMEYFLDTDPGYGLAQAITNIHVGNNELTFDLSDAPWGAHVLYVRSQDSEGRWSATMSRPLYIERLQDIAYVEYFIDNDPGIGQATPLTLPMQDYKAHLLFDFEVSTASLSLGEHELFIRARDVFDQWTDVMSRRFTVVSGGQPDPPVGGGDLSRLEYFFDTDPGYGLGFPLEKPSTGTNTYLMSFTAVEYGAHVLYLRAQDDADNWSATLSRPLYVLNPQGVAAIEYFIDNDPGEGLATPVALPDSLTAPFAFEVPVNNMSDGAHQFSVRVKGLEGLWSPLSSEPFVIGNQNGIASISWTFPLAVTARRGEIVLFSESQRAAEGSRVQIFGTSGQLLMTVVWPVSQKELVLPLFTGAGTPVLVEADDALLGRVVRKVIAK